LEHFQRTYLRYRLLSRPIWMVLISTYRAVYTRAVGSYLRAPT